MRDRVLLCAFFFGLSFAATRCSGGDSTPLDGGTDATQDVFYEYNVPETPPPVPAVVDVAAGAQHTCAIVSYGTQFVTYCFGADAALGGTKQGLLAIAASGLGSNPNLLSVASGHGAGHTCGVDTNKQVWCWGDDSKGQCGQGNPHPNIATPLVALDYQLGISKAITKDALAVGTSSTCVIRSSDGKLTCFGDNTSCQTDLYDQGGCSASPSSATPTTDTGVVFLDPTVVGLGAAHGCVGAVPLPSGSPTLFCFGDNASLESGPSGKTITTPAANLGSPSIVSIAGGDGYTCYVTGSPHQLSCFGKNDVHQADPTSATSPIDPSTPSTVALPQGAIPSMVAARASETCVVDVNGVLYCFGQGHGGNVDPIASVKDVGKLVMGGGHTCVIGHLPSDASTTAGKLLCWGDNTSGQAGQTAGTTVATPTEVALPQTAPTGP